MWFLDQQAVVASSYLRPESFADTRWQIRALGDFTGDGKTDVLWHHVASGDLYVWFLDGTVAVGGSYLTPRSSGGTEWAIRGTADLDADGHLDLLWHHQTTGELYVWFMDGLAVKSGAFLTPRSFSDTRWQIRGVADLTGDGKPDLLWHNQVTGELYKILPPKKGGADSHAKSSPKQNTPPPQREPTLWDRLSAERKLDVVGIVLAFFGIVILLGLISANRSAIVGGAIFFLAQLFGWGVYILPIGLLVFGLWLVFRKIERIPPLSAERAVEAHALIGQVALRKQDEGNKIHVLWSLARRRGHAPAGFSFD